MRVLHLSDVHFGGEDAPAAAGALDFARDYAPDVVICTGDVTLNGLPREFGAAKAWLSALPKPWLCTPGNHDTPYWNLLLRALTPFARYRKWIGDPRTHDAFDSAQMSVRMINTSRGAQPRPDWSKGAINLDACREATAELSRGAGGSLRIVGLHHPLVEAVGAPVTGGVHRGADAARLLADGGVDLILSGHVHTPFAVPLAGGDARTYAVGACTLSVRTRGAPPGFNVIEADAEQVTVVAQGWTGSSYAPWRSWSLPRRAR